MLSLYEILKASKTGIAPDMWTALAGANFGGAGSGAETKEITGIPPLSIRSNGTMLLDYLISGNMEQSGTPTPTTPIQPQGTGERTGNLWGNLGFSAITMNTSGIHTLSNNYGTSLSTVSGGSVDITQVASGNTIAYQNGFFFIEIDISQFSLGDNIVISFDYEITNKAGSISTTVSYVGQGTTATTVIADWSNSGRAIIKATVTSAMTKPYVEIRLCGNSIKVRNVQINTGSTALPYEPYGYKIPISSANTTTPIYLGEVPTTRRIAKLVLTGEEAFTYSSQDDNRYVCSIAYSTLNMSDVIGICSHFVWKSNYNPTVYNRIVRANNTTFYLSLANDLLDEVSTNGFKAYLQQQYANGTPVTIWYVLATPTTAIVNEPLRKIGDYADTVSYEQAGVQIPTNRGNTVIDVDTTLKPSQMYIKYQK